jgi:hypothetical protein
MLEPKDSRATVAAFVKHASLEEIIEAREMFETAEKRRLVIIERLINRQYRLQRAATVRGLLRGLAARAG